MEVAVVVCEDRHCGTEAYLFSDPVYAVQYARALALVMARGLSEPDERPLAGCLYNARVEDVGSVRVQMQKVDAFAGKIA